MRTEPRFLWVKGQGLIDTTPQHRPKHRASPLRLRRTTHSQNWTALRARNILDAYPKYGDKLSAALRRESAFKGYAAITKRVIDTFVAQLPPRYSAILQIAHYHGVPVKVFAVAADLGERDCRRLLNEAYGQMARLLEAWRCACVGVGPKCAKP